MKDVLTIQFTPESLGDNYMELDEKELSRRTEQGMEELKNHINELYAANFILELHDYPFLTREREFVLFFPAWNNRLKRVLQNFAEEFRDTYSVEVYGRHPSGYISYHSMTIEYYPKVISRMGKLITLNEEKALCFAEDAVKYLKKDYLQTK